MTPGHRGYLKAHVTYLTELHFLFSKVTNNGIDVVTVWLSLLWIPRQLYLFLFYKVQAYIFWDSLVAQLVKNPPAIQETPVWFLGQEDSLEKG